MANREIDEQLAMLIDVEYEGGQESLEDAIADLPKNERQRLLCLAVVEVMESRVDAERDFKRLVRRLEKQRGSNPNPSGLAAGSETVIMPMTGRALHEAADHCEEQVARPGTSVRASSLLLRVRAPELRPHPTS